MYRLYVGGVVVAALVATMYTGSWLCLAVAAVLAGCYRLLFPR